MILKRRLTYLPFLSTENDIIKSLSLKGDEEYVPKIVRERYYRGVIGS